MNFLIDLLVPFPETDNFAGKMDSAINKELTSKDKDKYKDVVSKEKDKDWAPKNKGLITIDKYHANSTHNYVNSINVHHHQVILECCITEYIH